MAGTAQTTRFMRGAATIMLGGSNNLWDLQPSTNSLGLAKNVSVMTEPVFIDLTQGTTNSLVYSMLTGNPLKISAEIFEYTAKNLNYGLSLNGGGVNTFSASTVQRSTGIDGDPTPTTDVLVADTTGFSVNDYIMIVPPGADDAMLVRQIATVVTSPAKFTVTHAINIDVALYTVKKVNLVKVGDTLSTNPFLACKIAGQLVDGTPAVFLFPKVRVTKGFTMAFNVDQYGFLPFELQVYDQLSTDPFYSEFPTSKGGLYIQ